MKKKVVGEKGNGEVVVVEVRNKLFRYLIGNRKTKNAPTLSI